MNARRAAVLAALGLILLGSRGDAQSPIVADLSSHLIAVTTGFTGADLLLFGAVMEPGEIGVVVRGPAERVTVRRKERVLGVWVHGDSEVFENVPAFYGLASTERFRDAASPALAKRLQFGIENLRLDPTERDAAAAAPFRVALVESRRRRALFPSAVEPIAVLGDRLFRTVVRFPSSVPTGTYRVEVFFVREGEVVSAQTTPLSVSRLGLGAEVYSFARDQAAIYGAFAVLIAIAAGWLAGFVFRRG